MKKFHGLLILLFSINLAAQNAWTKPKGDYYFQTSYTFIPTYSEISFNNEANTFFTGRSISDKTIQIYGEYGITNKLTIIASLPLKSINTNEIIENASLPVTINEGSITRLGNPQIGLRQKLYEQKFNLSAQLNVGLNTSDFDELTGIRADYDTWTIAPTFNFGKGYETIYYQLNTGIDFRTNDYSSNFKFGAEFGLTALKNTTLIVYSNIVISFKNGGFIPPATNLETVLFTNDQEYISVGLKGIYKISPKISLNGGIGGALYHKNLAKSPAISIGIALEN